jgi:O-acetyl-ADP-ribose deacetylase (regulator of RNase III)
MLRIQLFAGDITTLNVDAIVNAANESLLGGGGVDGAIHEAAGAELVAESRQLAPCSPGNAKLTRGFDLLARYVIHAVGPIYTDGTRGESAMLEKTYQSVLQIATDESFDSIAIPCISTGAYRFPQRTASEIAIETVRKWQSQYICPRTVVFCCFESSDVSLYNDRLDELGILQLYAR